MTGPAPIRTGLRAGGMAALLGGLQRGLRDLIVPLDRVAEVVPAQGRVLEVGCGEGLVLKRLVARSTRVVGVDIDERKILGARQRFAGQPHVELVLQDAFTYLSGTPDGSFTTALLVDTLSGFAPGDQLTLLAEMYRVLEPSGLLVLKAIDGDVRWKAALSRALSGLVCGVFQMSFSAGQKFTYMSADALREALEALGGVVVVRHLHRERFHPIPHVLLVARKPAVSRP